MRVQYFLVLVLAASVAGCSLRPSTPQPNMGTPVGTWKLGSSTVTFDADGTVTRLDEGNAPDPDFLAPLQSGKPGRWTIKGRALTLIATNPGGAETKVNYEYSVGTDDKGKPALSIDITSGPHKNSTYTLVRE